MNFVSTNDVTVTNNINVSANSSGGTSESKSHTKITTTTNGETFHLESNESGEIRVETKNGETTVKTSPGMKVNITEGTAKVEDTLSPSSTKSADATKSAEEVVKKVKKMQQEIKLNIFQQLEKSLKSFFERFKL